MSLAVALPSRAAAAAPYVGTGTHPWAVVMCDFSDESATPHTQAYYQQLFSDAGAGQLGELDFWHDVSFGQLSISGTTVTPTWVVAKNPSGGAKLDRQTWNGLDPQSSGANRLGQIQACADGATGINWSNYWGVLTIFPEVRATLASAINATQTTITVNSTTGFPSGGSPYFLGVGGETVKVTAVNGTTLTVQRGIGTNPAISHAAGAEIAMSDNWGASGFGQKTIDINGTNQTLATVSLPSNTDVSTASHEMGHGFGYQHTRKLSRPLNEYNDCYDLMSWNSCPGNTNSFSPDPSAGSYYRANGGTDFGDSGVYVGNVGEEAYAKGPGLDAINLDDQGWIPAARHFTLNNAASTQSTVSLHALGDPSALSSPSSQYLEARVPAAITIENQPDLGGGNVRPPNPPKCSGYVGYKGKSYAAGCTTSQYYTVEYRQAEGWDRGFANNVVLLHLFGGDGLSYWVDQTPNAHAGTFLAGDEYVDAASKAFVAVNAIDPSTQTAQVTLASRQINSTLAGISSGTAVYNMPVTVSATLAVTGSNAPVPNAQVTLSDGTDSCTGTTDATGHVSCSLTPTAIPGAHTLTASFAGDTAYAAGAGSAPFTIQRSPTKLFFLGQYSADYHDVADLGADLTNGGDQGMFADRVGNKTVTITIGAADSCQAMLSSAGDGDCSLTLSQKPGLYDITLSFAGDQYYLPSTLVLSQQFTINKEETTLSYDGPTQLANGAPATLNGTLLEDGTTAVSPSGQTVSFTIGSGASAQSCQGTVDPTGHVQCTIPDVEQPDSAAFSVAVSDSFAGDAYYLPSSGSGTAKLLYYTGRAFGASQSVAGGAPGYVVDTGPITTAQAKQTPESLATANLGLGTLTAVSAGNTTGGGASISQTSVASATLGGGLLPKVSVTGISTSSTSKCSAATGTATIAKLTVNGASIPVNNLAPNTKLSVAGLTITLNEQQPVPGAAQGLTVNALHIVFPGLIDYVLGSATSDIDNC